ncbi:hypothetical protein R3P38DRAFT_3367443 [Favolaschia claudopus]|uniref:Uncharacterized protein n=1 Tax=Favolaschia claudopus TaxID=2862362 RepID=A0AAW0A9P7_9AGAR
MLFKDIKIGEHDKVIHTISQDEIAGDGRPCYLVDSDEIGGLCEHASAELETVKMGTDLTAVTAAVRPVREGRVHVGKEFSVAAIARHAPTDYGAKPVLVMPTCKHGSWQIAALNLQKILNAWKLSPYGEALHGPVKTIASDGASDRRRALYLLCMQEEVKCGNPLWEFLKDLPGLNLFTGPGGLTMCFDPKHTWKRDRKNVISKEGTVVGGVAINKNLLAQ